MRNAKEELKQQIEYHGKLRAAEVSCEKVIKTVGSDGKTKRKFVEIGPFYLFPDYTEQELDSFLNYLDFDYNAGYGMQELFGTLWFVDGTWSDRFEYDGSEHWERHQLPTLPDRVRVAERLAERERQKKEEEENEENSE